MNQKQEELLREKQVGCKAHNIVPLDEHWKVIMEELESEEDINFSGQVCPVCYLMLRERLVQSARNLRVESRENVALRAESSQLRMIVDAVVVALKEVTGEDAYELAKRVYKPTPTALVEHGKLVRIIPNLISEAATRKKRK